MSNTEKAQGGSANYSAEQEAELLAASPVSYDDAMKIAEKWGKSLRSVIAKVQSLEECEYIPKAKPEPKRATGRTKVETAAMIRKLIDRKALGLEKAPASALNDLLSGLQHLTMGDNASD